MSPGREAPSLYLIDAHALIFQVFHAIPGMSSAATGLPTNALFGFTRDMLFLHTEKRPDYLVCAFDVSGPTFRDEIYPEYKANRAPMPNDLQLQIPEIYRLLEAMRIPVIAQQRFEADDIIATLATAGAERGMDVFICTSDKDARQLISDRIRIYNFRKNQVLDREGLLADWGVSPEQVADLQALTGDTVDNVKGVAGIGVKTAARLLQEFQTLDNVLAAAAGVAAVSGSGGKKTAVRSALTPRLAEKIREAADAVALSRRLVRLDTGVPFPLDWDAWRLGEWDAERLLALFKEWSFHRFADQVRKQSEWSGAREQKGDGANAGAAGAVQPSAGAGSRRPRSRAKEPGETQGQLFDNEPDEGRETNGEAPPASVDGPALIDNWKATYHLVDTPEKFEAFYSELARQKRFALDLETTGLEPRRAEIVGYAFCWEAGVGWYLPVRGPEGAAILEPVQTLTRLRLVLEDPTVAKVNQNIKYDMLVLRQHGVALAGVAGDSMIAHYLLHSGERSHSMDTLARSHLSHQVIPITDLIGKKGKKQLRMDQVPTARVAEYAGEDADVAWRLCAILEPHLAANLAASAGKRTDEPRSGGANEPPPEAPLRKLYDDLEIPLVEVLAELEFNGIRLDVPLLKRQSEEMGRELAAIEQDIYRLAGREFNIASLKQLRQVLFDEVKLPVQRKTGLTSEASTDQDTLERLAALKSHPGHELPRKILEHRQISKLKGTYVDALPALVNPATGRVHASFNQTVAATGRLSSSDPNLQNVPVRREQGQQIRQAFIPEDGWLLLTADYSQVELRLLAHFCGDAALRRAFAEDRDIHASVAAQIFGVPESEVTSEMRRVAKTVNFGVIYGISAFGLAPRLEITREEAERFIDAYFARYPGVLEYQTRLLANCRKNCHVSTILGRRRPFDPKGIRERSTYQQRNQPEREAINMEIQGSAADLIKVAMLNIYRRLRAEKRQARMLLQIHDELVFEVPPGELEAVAALVADEMSGALRERLEVPLRVDLAAGRTWLDVDDLSGQHSAVSDQPSKKNLKDQAGAHSIQSVRESPPEAAESAEADR